MTFIIELPEDKEGVKVVKTDLEYETPLIQNAKCRYCGNRINGDQSASFCSGDCVERYYEEVKKRCKSDT